MPDELSVQCPYCGEEVSVDVDELGPSRETYIEDCSVCCRPWTVTITRGDEGPTVELARDDD